MATFLKGRAYTVDNILITRVKVSYRREQLQFVRMSLNLLDANLLMEQRKIGEYDVIFSQPEIAAKVLAKETSLNNLITVEAKDSLSQPAGYKIIKELRAALLADNLNGNYNCVENDTQVSIFKLNKDCLANIFNYLKLSEQISFALTCRRAYNIFARLCKKEYTVLNIMNTGNVTPFQAAVLLPIIGPNVERLIIDFKTEYEILFEFLTRFCPYVQYLKAVSIKGGLLANLIRNMTLVNDLMLVRCHFNEDVVHNLKQLNNLETLIISYPKLEPALMATNENAPTIVMGEIIASLTNLKSYSIYDL